MSNKLTSLKKKISNKLFSKKRLSAKQRFGRGKAAQVFGTLGGGAIGAAAGGGLGYLLQRKFPNSLASDLGLASTIGAEVGGLGGLFGGAIGSRKLAAKRYHTSPKEQKMLIAQKAKHLSAPTVAAYKKILKEHKGIATGDVLGYGLSKPKKKHAKKK